MPHRTFCSIVPPYVLEALATSGDPVLEERARETLRHDEAVRASRRVDPAVRLGERAATAPKRSRVERGTAEAPSRVIYDAKRTQTLPGTQVRAEGDAPTTDEAADQAYDGLGATWELFQEAYDRNSLDDKGLAMLATVHYGKNYDNAFWNGSQMVFGDGDGEVFLGFTRSIDVIGHELAHGVTQYTSGLNYEGQSGALNESVSDVFGVLVKQRALGQDAAEADWLIGADLLAPGVKGRALRDMANPGTAYDDPRLGKDPQPAHMDDFVDTDDDNGGVHINSGIPNRAFHLVATTLGGKAWEDAGEIWYAAITGDIKADCDFATFARLTHEAAVAQHGADSEQAKAVAAAWVAVGVKAAEAPKPRPRTRKAKKAADVSDAPKEPAPDQPNVPVSAEVSVRRTGGFAGLTKERTVTLGELPTKDTRAWQSLLAGPRLQALASARPEQEQGHPDGYTYVVTCDRPEVTVRLPEPALPDKVRGLFDRTLDQP